MLDNRTVLVFGRKGQLSCWLSKSKENSVSLGLKELDPLLGEPFIILIKDFLRLSLRESWSS